MTNLMKHIRSKMLIRKLHKLLRFACFLKHIHMLLNWPSQFVFLYSNIQQGTYTNSGDKVYRHHLTNVVKALQRHLVCLWCTCCFILLAAAISKSQTSCPMKNDLGLLVIIASTCVFGHGWMYSGCG
jgi:hypothetical protein